MLEGENGKANWAIIIKALIVLYDCILTILISFIALWLTEEDKRNQYNVFVVFNPFVGLTIIIFAV